jgi:hypothetical protein
MNEPKADSAPLGRRTRRALRRIQRRLQRYYALETAPDVVEFAAAAEHGEREVLLVRDHDGSIELALVIPNQPPNDGANDLWLQLAEGVSHFVHVAERARTGLPTTQLELELQAEVDKFVLLALEPPHADAARLRTLHRDLFDSSSFLHPAGTELGERYRLANALAARLAAALLRRHKSDARTLLQRFYRVGQAEKIALARAA